MSLLKRKLTLLIVPILVVAGAAGAYAATQTSAGASRQAFLSDVARRLHVTPQQLRSALDGAFSDRLAAEVAAGRLTKAQAKVIEQRLKRTGAVPFGVGFGPPAPGSRFPGGVRPRPGAMPGRAHGAKPGWGPGTPPGLSSKAPHAPGAALAPGFGFAFGFGLLPAGAKSVTSYLGISASKLQSDLRAGKSLAQIATAQGRTASGLESAIDSSVRTELSKQVAAKRLTKAQAQKLLTHLGSQITAIVNRRLPKLGPRGMRFRPGKMWSRHFQLPPRPGRTGKKAPKRSKSGSKSASGAVSSLFVPA